MSRLFDLAYLFEPMPGPLSITARYLHLLLGTAFAVGLMTALLHLRRRTFPRTGATRATIALTALFCGLGLVLIAARLGDMPVLSTRALLGGTLLATIGALTGFLVPAYRWRAFLAGQLRVLSFQFVPTQPTAPWPVTAFLLGAHLLGLAALFRFYHQHPLWAVVALSALLSPQLIPSLRSRRWAWRFDASAQRGCAPSVVSRLESCADALLETLTPLFLPYVLLFGRAFLIITLRQPIAPYDGMAMPNPWRALFNLDAALLASVVYLILCQGHMLLIEAGKGDRWMAYAAVTLALLSFTWAGAEYLIHRPRGVTGSDPYCYVQMAVDIAKHGSPIHTFPLFPPLSGSGIAWWPLVHVGYHLPYDEAGHAATVWPVGHSMLLAVGYLLLGEEGLYLTTPLVGLLSLLALWALANELFHQRPWQERALIGALSVFILATSYQQIENLLIPMADVSAQLFSTLTIYFALRAIRGHQRLYATLSGLCLGFAYLIRHTQLVLILTLPLVVLLWRRSSKVKWGEFLCLSGLAALIVAIPDLLYHHLAFGHFLRPESQELQYYGLSHVAETLLSLTSTFLAGNEFGFVALFVLYGAYRMFKDAPARFWVLCGWFLPLVSFQLPYRYLKLRDLLPAFPPLIVLYAYGMSVLFRRALAESRPGVLRSAFIIFFLLFLLSLRTQLILTRPFTSTQPRFGYLTASQRRAFDDLARYTPESSVIGTTLNSGPIDLYAQRLPFRPAYWTSAEFETFLRAMFDRGLPIYILDDGVDLSFPLAHAEEHHRLIPVVKLDVPFYGNPRRIPGQLYKIEP